jgi:threonyl-tRNA synthetase
LNLKSFARVEPRCQQRPNVLNESGINYVEVANEAAFYGPKIDVQGWRCLHTATTSAVKSLQTATNPRHIFRDGLAGTSLCPLVAVRKDFGPTCPGKDNSNKTPLCIHRAPLGTHERFIGFLIEHYAGNFPLWLAPDQVRVITLNDDAALIDYAQPIVNELRANMVRVDTDFTATPFKAKIADAEQLRVHTMLVIGSRDMKSGAVSVRLHHGGPQGAKPKAEVVADILAKIRERRP